MSGDGSASDVESVAPVGGRIVSVMEEVVELELED